MRKVLEREREGEELRCTKKLFFRGNPIELGLAPIDEIVRD